MSGNGLYRIFDVPMACDFPLPELPAWPAGNQQARIEIRLGLPQGFDRQSYQSALDWRGPDGEVICSVARKAADHWFEFPGRAGFLITQAGQVYCDQDQACEDALLRHFLLNQVVPRYLGTKGRLVLHASAVVLPDGRAVGFVGRSGSGKSTLASSFLNAGAELLADDCVMVQGSGDEIQVVGAFPGIRLHERDVRVLFGAETRFSDVDAYSGKRRAVFSGNAAPRPLAALFLLARPDGENSEIATTEVPGAQAMLACLESVLCLDPGHESATVAAFGGIGGVLGGGMPVLKLHYPRRHDALIEVRAVVLEVVANQTPRLAQKVL